MNDLSDIFDRHKKSVVDFIDGVRMTAYQKGRADAIDESLRILHNVYGKNEYCAKSECAYGGVGCDDCLYAVIQKKIRGLKDD